MPFIMQERTMSHLILEERECGGQFVVGAL